MARSKDGGGSAVERLREFGLRYPGAHTKSPWPGHLDLAVNDKTFAYLSLAGEPLSISCKLPRSSDSALSLPFTTPTAYGLGKSGWVTATFPDDTEVPVEMLEEWIDESYRAQAPKRLSARLPAAGEGLAVEATPTRPRPGAPLRATPVVGRRSTVKQKPGATARRAPAARTAQRPAAPAAKPERAGRRTTKRADAGAKKRAGSRAKKRSSVSQRAAPRSPKQRRRTPE